MYRNVLDGVMTNVNVNTLEKREGRKEGREKEGKEGVRKDGRK